MAHQSLALALALTVGFGLALGTAVEAQVSLLGQEEPDAPVAAGAQGTIYRPSRPFVIGRDNLAFANFQGAIRIPGAAGNCYTFAEVAKLFYDLAEYRPGEPGGDGRGFDPAEAAGALEAAAYPARCFPVRGYGALAELSATPEGLELEPWVEDEVRERAGLARRHGEASRAAVRPVNAEALVALYRLITTIHYLHYVQYQASGLVARVAERVLAGEDGVRRSTLATVDELERRLPQGDLGLLLIFNADPAVSFGHVVLAYQVVDAGTHADVYVYDSNQQYGRERAESVLRVTKATGRYRLLKRDPETGALEADPGYDGEAWFNAPRTCSLSLLADTRAEAEPRRALAAKLRRVDETAAYALATGDLLRDLTGRAPGESALQDDLVRFVRALQAIQARTGGRRGRELPEGASAAELGAWLEAELDPGLAEALPFFVPRGIGLSGTRIVPSVGDRNRLRLETTLTLAPGAEPAKVIEALRSCAALAGDATLAHLVEALGKAFAGNPIRAWLALEVAKEASPDPRLGRFAPVPRLVGSRITVGNLGPADEPPPAAAFTVEIAEKFVKQAFDTAMRAEGVLGVRHKFPLEVEVAGTKVGTELELAVDKLAPELDYICAWVGGRISGSVAGVDFSTPYPDYVMVYLEPTATRDVFEVTGDSRFYLQVHGAVGWLVDTAASLVEPVFGTLFGAFAGRVEGLIQDHLESWVALPAGTAIEFEKVELESIDEGQKLKAKLKPFRVDLGATVRKLFGVDPPVTLTAVLLAEDRATLLFDPR